MWSLHPPLHRGAAAHLSDADMPVYYLIPASRSSRRGCACLLAQFVSE